MLIRDVPDDVVAAVDAHAGRLGLSRSEYVRRRLAQDAAVPGSAVTVQDLARFAEVFATRTRDEWAEVFAGSDGCVAPVLSAAEAPGHPHNAARGTFADIGGVVQPAPAPRFGRSAADSPAAPPKPGADTDAVLSGLGCTPSEISALRASGTIG